MPIGGPECGSDRMFSKLIEDDEELDPRPDVHMPGGVQSERRLSPSDPAMRPTIKVTGPYRMASICLATLCGVLLVAIIAVTAHYKNKAAGGAAAEAQMQTADVDALNAVISQLRREKDDLQKKLDARTTLAAAGPRAATSPTSPVVCPPDWLFFNSSCYFISEVSRNWPVSQAYCESKGAHLAVILAADEQTFLWDQLPRGHWNAYWIGITDGHTEDRWTWVDGTPLVGGFWEEGEPNNHIDEDCGYIVKTRVLERVALRSWYDAPCDMFRPFICEKELDGAHGAR